MRISVVIPVYNVEDYLRECIESVIMQSYQNKEIILVNDGSTDNSQQICEEYQKKYSYIKVINKANQGLSHTRNVGIKNATGDYILFLDSDDYWAIDFMSDLKELVESDEEIDYIFFRHKTYKQNTNYYEEQYLNVDRSKIKNRKGIDVLTYLLDLHKDFQWYAWKGLIRKEFLIKNNLFFEVGRNYEDALWAPNVFLKAQTVDYYDEAVYVYRLERDGQITSNVSIKNLQDSIYIAKYWFERLENETIDPKTKQIILENIVSERYYYAIWFSGFLKKEKKEKIIQELKENNNLLSYHNSLVTKSTYYLSRILGFKITTSLFKIVITLVRNVQRLQVKNKKATN